jgi:parallel beta-helix repeat protein
MRGIILVILILIVGAATAARITVGPVGEDFPLIQKAIDNATQGDVVEVHSGTYFEHVYLPKAITLIGVDTGNGRPVVNASGTSSALTISANGSTIQGFNFTGSGHCGCGNAGILVRASNNTIHNNILYKNKYGIYVKPGYANNTFIANDFLDNEISATDQGSNNWSGSLKAQNLKGFVGELDEAKIKGNHYSDYDEPSEGCKDLNDDGLCDLRKKISGGKSIDINPSIVRENP